MTNRSKSFSITKGALSSDQAESTDMTQLVMRTQELLEGSKLGKVVYFEQKIINKFSHKGSLSHVYYIYLNTCAWHLPKSSLSVRVHIVLFGLPSNLTKIK